MNCKMISMDTSTVNTGYAIWHNASLVLYGALQSEKGTDKFLQMANMILSLLEREQPDIVIVELTANETNGHTQRVLTKLLGIVHGWCVLQSVLHGKYIDYVEYYPTMWRKLAFNYDENAESSLFLNNKGKLDHKKRAIGVLQSRYGIVTKNDNMAEAIFIGEARIREFESFLSEEEI